MDPNMIRQNYSDIFVWKEILEPYLDERLLKFESVLLIKEIQQNTSYVGFVKVSKIDPEQSAGMWFTDWIKVSVVFDDAVYLRFEPVHLRKEILMFEKGNTLLDNRDGLK